MLDKVRKRFINNIKKSFLDLTDMKVIKKRIEKRGYTTSRIYGHKNVKRLSAYDSDKNRIEFILSEKNLYIIFSLSFSNRLHQDLIIISTNKNKDFLKYLKEINLLKTSPIIRDINSIYFSNSNIVIKDSFSVYYSKSFCADVKRVSDMWAINLISITRDRIIEEEMNMDILPFFSEVKGKTKETLIKNISKDTVAMLIKGNLGTFSADEYTLPHRIESIENRTFYYGFVFYKYLVSKYRFTDEEISSFLKKEILPYLVKNRVELIKIGSSQFSHIQEIILKKLNVEFFKDLLIESDEDKSWFQSINSKLQIANSENYDLEINF